jgi:hypothetical protein
MTGMIKEAIITLFVAFLPLDGAEAIQAFTSEADSECKDSATGAVIAQCGTSDLYPDCDSTFSSACSSAGGTVQSCSSTCDDVGNPICNDNDDLYADCNDFETECETANYYIPVSGSNGVCSESETPVDQHFCCDDVDLQTETGEDCVAIGAVAVGLCTGGVLYCDGSWGKNAAGEVKCF